MPALAAADQFGQSVLAYYDVDRNDIADFVVGAPGDDVDSFNNLTDTGAIYIIFLERIPYVWPVIDLTLFYVLVTVLPGCYCICCIVAIVCFLRTFRHEEDEVEKIAREAGMGSVKLGSSVKGKSLSQRSSKILVDMDNEGKDEEDIETGPDTGNSRPNSAKSDRSAKSAKSDKDRPISPGAGSVKKQSSKKSKKSVYDRQKSGLQTYSKKITDFDDDERVDEYF
jgi:hypothetical protein